MIDGHNVIGNRRRRSHAALLVCGLLAVAVLGAVGVGAATTTTATADLETDGPTVASDNVTVTYTVTNQKGSTANLTLATQTPDDWTITANSTASGGTWHGDGNVTWTNVPDGETRTAEITYEASSPTASIYLFNATVYDVDADERVANATHAVVVPENAVWERSVLPLRASTDDAATVIDNQRVIVNDENGTENDVNRDELAVFGTDTDATIEFSQTDGADVSRYAGEDLRVIVGHAAADPSANASMLPTSGAEARALLSSENRSEINRNVEFSDAGTISLDGAGEGNVTLDTSDPGQYVVVAVEGERLFDVENGNVSPVAPSNGTIVGVEGVAVQSGASTVDEPGTVARGEPANFTVQTGLTGNVSHTVVVYDEDTFTSSQTVVNLTASPSLAFDSDDVRIEHEIETLNGVVQLKSNASALGFAVPARTEAGSLLVSSIVASAASETDGGDVETVATGDVVLNGSAIAVANVNASGVVSVPTFGNWSTGEYRYVHVASEQNSTRAFETNTGTIAVEEASDGDDGGSGGGGGGYAPIPPDDGGEDGVSFTDLELSDVTVEPGQNFQVTVTVTNPGSDSVTRTVTLLAGDVAIDSKTVTVAGDSSTEVTFEGSLGLEGTYDLTIDGSSLGTIEVARSQQTNADISVVSADVSDSIVTAGDSVTVTAAVENFGEQDGSATIDLVVDGETVDNQYIAVAGGETAEIEFSTELDEPGSYEIHVDNIEAGTVTVDPVDDGGDGDGGSGLWSIVLVFLFVGGVTVSAVVGYLYYIGELEAVIDDFVGLFR